MFPRLYAICDVELCVRRGIDPLQLTDIWIEAGIRLLQLRAKTLPSGEFLRLASVIGGRARSAGATFIVNDRADIALASSATGVHVGQEDLSPSDVRTVVSPAAVVGVSTHNAEQVTHAIAQPIDYVAIGPVFSTSSKVNPDPVVGLAGVRRAVELSGGFPVVAIGGITLQQAGAVLAEGASSVAVISDLLGPDLGARAQEFIRALET